MKTNEIKTLSNEIESDFKKRQALVFKIKCEQAKRETREKVKAYLRKWQKI